MQTLTPLRANDVHLWTVPLDVAPEQLPALHGLLDEEEQLRASRFRFDRDRHGFIAGRAALRQILALYLDDSAEAIRFIYGPHGKPGVAESSIQFNMSHSGAFGVIGIARRRIGVDIERLRELDYRALSERFFAPHEIAALHELVDSELQRGFFRCWTRKEAYVKARGDALFRSLRDFAVSVGLEPAPLVWSRLGTEEVGRWVVLASPEQMGYEVAVVVEKPVEHIITRQWDPVA